MRNQNFICFLKHTASWQLFYINSQFYHSYQLIIKQIIPFHHQIRDKQTKTVILKKKFILFGKEFEGVQLYYKTFSICHLKGFSNHHASEVYCFFFFF